LLSLWFQQFLRRPLIIGLPQRKERRMLTVPSDTVANSVLIPVHDLEPGDRSLVPMLDFAQDGLDVIGHRPPTVASVDNDNRVRRDRVGEIGLRCRFFG